jgi:hypothetical protein
VPFCRRAAGRGEAFCAANDTNLMFCPALVKANESETIALLKYLAPSRYAMSLPYTLCENIDETSGASFRDFGLVSLFKKC